MAWFTEPNPMHEFPTTAFREWPEEEQTLLLWFARIGHTIEIRAVKDKFWVLDVDPNPWRWPHLVYRLKPNE